jgi:predicted PolB exonuclease-like 3'-5' exonuclease
MKSDLFHIDIETAGNYKDYETFLNNDERGARLFMSKYEKMNWPEKYEDINQAYIENAGIISTYGKIVCISFGFIDNEGNNKISSYYGDNEEEIVKSFNNLLKKIETKNFNLSGFHILHFDIVWILHKLHKYGIKPASIIYTYDKKPWEMRITDISDDWKSRFTWSFSFDELTYELGINSTKDTMDGSQVHEYYYSDRIEDIKTYCEKDVESCIKVSKIIYK